MSQALIEGVGDEVTVFVCLLVLLIVLTLAWVSTSVTDRPFVSVIVLDGRTFQQFISRLRGRRASPPVEPAEGSSSGNTSASNSPSTENAPSSVQETVSAAAESEEGQPGDTVSPIIETSDKSQDGETLRNNPEQVGATLAEGASPASTPGSEGFVHLSGSSSTEDDRDTSAAPVVQPMTATVGQSSCKPEGSELRQRRLAFFTNPQSNDSTSTTSGASPDIVSSPVSADTASTTSEEPRSTQQPEGQQMPAAEPEAPTETEVFEPLDGHIRIRIKYLDDRQRWVQARPEETIGQFKRTHFGSELRENTMIRFIYNGRELTRDGQSLASYNIGDESVIHCLVSQVSRQNHDDMAHGAVQFDMGTLMLPLFGLILALIWYSRFTYKQYFNTMSTLTLIGISFLFVVALFASLRVQDHPDPVEVE